MADLMNPRLAMYGTTNTEDSKQKPLVFHLPDGDLVEIAGNDTIMHYIDVALHMSLDQMDLISNSLKRINSRLRHMLYVYGDEGAWGVIDQDRLLSNIDRLPFVHPSLEENPNYWLHENKRVPLARKDWT
jgi:hypothetical protein